jgi:hypothetical protein
MEAHHDRLWDCPPPVRKAGGWNTADHSFRRYSSSPVRTQSFVPVAIFNSFNDHPLTVRLLIFSPRASLFLGASQHLRGKRAEELGWQPRPVVLEEWADEGITSALAKLTPLQN